MDIFNNLWVLAECLLDEQRTKAFQEAIEEIVNPGDIVLDAGTGSGILALFAARAGAKKVYAVDIARDTLLQAETNFVNNGYEDKIQIYQADLIKFNSIQSVDVLIMEMLDTGLVSEQQAPALNNLRKNGVITDTTKMLPYRAVCAVEPVQYDFQFYGFNMPFIIEARNDQANLHVDKILGEAIVYKDIDFSNYIDTQVNEMIELYIRQEGILNAIRLQTQTYLSPKISLGATSDMNMPAIIPLEETRVKDGDTVKIHISYTMGEGFGNFKMRKLEVKK